MAKEYKYGGHSVHDIQYHLCWCTKYRYPVLRGEVGERCRDLLRQIAMAREITIIWGALAPDHVHMLISAPPVLAAAKIVQYLKGRSSRKLQMEYRDLKKTYWGKHIWARGYFCVTTGVVNDQMIKDYIEHHREEDEEEFTIDKT